MLIKLAVAGHQQEVGHLRSTVDHYKNNQLIVQTSKQNLKAVFIDPAISMELPGGEYYRIEANGQALYQDGSHLTRSAIREFILPDLRKAMLPSLKKTRAELSGGGIQ